MQLYFSQSAELLIIIWEKTITFAHKYKNNIYYIQKNESDYSIDSRWWVKTTTQLIETQKRLNKELHRAFGPCPAEHDNDYIFHMTFAIGGACYESYKEAYEKLRAFDIKRIFRFSRLGLFYYDDDNITPGTYFCYKMCKI